MTSKFRTIALVLATLLMLAALAGCKVKDNGELMQHQIKKPEVII